jgi:hypothetical protein
MQVKPKYFFALIVGLLIVFSCEKENDFSEIPFLKFVGHEFTEKDGQRFIRVELYFNDRDGDIGLNDGDTLPPFNLGSEYFNNLWVTGFLVVNGIFRDTFPGFDGRIPDLTPQGQNKSLEGSIFYDLPTDGLAVGDSMAYEFILIDRALNRSDAVLSPVIRIAE